MNESKVEILFRQDHIHAGVLYKKGTAASFDAHEAAAIRRAGSAEEESGGRKATAKPPADAAA